MRIGGSHILKAAQVLLFESGRTLGTKVGIMAFSTPPLPLERIGPGEVLLPEGAMAEIAQFTPLGGDIHLPSSGRVWWQKVQARSSPA